MIAHHNTTPAHDPHVAFVAAEANMGLPMLSALARGRSHNAGASATDEAVIE
jgi:hypothetical protein